MKLINRNTDYAIRALCFMAEHNQKEQTISVSELVERLKIPRPFLRKILQMLNKRGLVRSYRGIAGGFKLTNPPDAIFLVDLIEIFQGPLKLNECILKKNICPDTLTCVLRKKIEEIERQVITGLKSITIESLLDGTAK
jgi:Rrf2 family protein